MILADGTVMNRTQVVDSLQHAPPWDGYSIDDPVVQVLDDAVALLRYTGTGRRNDGDDFTAAMVSVYVRAAGEWRLASYQQTPSDRA